MTKKYFQKTIDKRVALWYNYYRKREGKPNKPRKEKIMTTINRNALNELANKVNEEKRLAKIERLEKLIEERVLPELVEKAKAGCYSHIAQCFCDCNVADFEIIKKTLEEKYGFTVKDRATTSLTLVICWDGENN
jgi:hypothetical protein